MEMCDTSTEAFDELIEFELRDCIEVDGDQTNDGIFYQQEENDDYEAVEQLDDDDTEDESKNENNSNNKTLNYNNIKDLNVKSFTLTNNQQFNETTCEIKDELLDVTEVINEVETFTTKKRRKQYQQQFANIIREPEYVTPDSESITSGVRGSNVKGKNGAINTPRRYMLFDELVACIVDHDAEGAPIVEFAMPSSEADNALPVECGICPDVMHKSKLSKHLKTHLVPGTKRYQCIYCEETYKDCKYLAGHARRHMGIRPYVCELCKLYFSTKQDLRVHNQRRHQKKEHICEMCGKTFAQNTQLKRHRESTHEKKRRFKCEHCPKSYYKNFSLQEHIRAVHMGKRRMIVCPFCGMQCRDAHKMARHRKQMHLNQSHYECHICHEEFTDINYFDAHKRSIQCRNNTRRKLEEEARQQQQLDQEEGDEDKEHNEYDEFQNELIILPAEGDDQYHLEQEQQLEETHLILTGMEDVKPVLLDSGDQEDFINQKFIQMLPTPEDEPGEEEELIFEITIDSDNIN